MAQKHGMISSSREIFGHLRGDLYSRLFEHSECIQVHDDFQKIHQAHDQKEPSQYIQIPRKMARR